MIKVLDKAFSILETIVLNSPRPMRISVLAEQFGINNATCARIIRDLTDAGYVIQISRQEGYAAGPRALTFANAVQYRPALLEAAAPRVDETARAFSASVLLTERQGSLRYVLLHRNESPRLMIRLTELAFHDLFTTATGLVLAAFAPATEQDVLLSEAAQTNSTLFDEKLGIRGQLAQIRKQKHACFLDPARGQGIAAFPVFRNGTCVASFGGSIPADEYEAQAPAFLAGLAQAAEAIGRTVSVIHTTG